ncbi:glutamate receptor 2.9-like [Wolffia australiana]
MIKEEVEAVLGPQTSDEAAFVALLGNANKVPVLSFSATSPSVSHDKTKFFIRAAVSDSFQATTIAALVSHFAWKQVVPIYEQSEFGAGIVPHVVNALNAIGVRVPYKSAIDPSSSPELISMELYKLMSMECKVFLVHMQKSLALRLFSEAREVGMMSKGFAWILSDALTSLLGTVNASVLRRDFFGVVGVNLVVPRSGKLKDFESRWLLASRLANPETERSDLTVFGLWAYDAVWALAMAAETVDPDKKSLMQPQDFTNQTVLMKSSASSIGPRLLDALLEVEFHGLSGEFLLVNGERKKPLFEIVNVAGGSQSTVGFWTEKDFLRDVGRDGLSFPSPGLSPVIWPGDTTTVPKGWDFNPVVGKKLRILVPGPVDPGFQRLLTAETDPETGKLVVGGYVIEVFETALKEMPYAVPVEYVQHRVAPGMKKPCYDELVQLVFQKKYDGLVGDTTITANRSNYVDFTLPYATSGIRMIVPQGKQRRTSALMFLKPLSWKLWIVTAGSFFFTGFVVWVLEHRLNEDFRGPIDAQVGTTSYFIFSTLVFAHKENIRSNIARVVIIIWVLVVLVLQSSYTASLSSMLFIKHLRSTTLELKDIPRGERVGYLKGSFTGKLLLKEGLDPRMLKPLTSPRDYVDALNNGSSGGGVGAIFDEIPYIRVFLKDYFKNYTMVGGPYKAGGFGFAFQKGSPLVPDLSIAILRLAEGDRIVEIEKRWLGDLNYYASEENNYSEERLNFDKIWGLFLITGVVSGLAMLVFLITLLREKIKEGQRASSGQPFEHKQMAVSKLCDGNAGRFFLLKPSKKAQVIPRDMDASTSSAKTEYEMSEESLNNYHSSSSKLGSRKEEAPEHANASTSEWDSITTVV